MRIPVRCLLVAMLLLAHGNCFANVPLPTIFAFDLALWAGVTAFVLSLIVVLLTETAVLVFLFHYPFRRATVLVAVANLVSSLAGAVLSFHPLELIGLVLVSVWCAGRARVRFRWAVWQSLWLGLAIPVLFVAVLWPQPTIIRTIVQFYATVIGAFALSVLIEALIFAKTVSPRQAWRWSLAANGASYVILGVVLLLAGFRSGAFAVREWHVFQLRHAPSTSAQQRAEQIRTLEEFYMWEETGMRSSIRMADALRGPWMEIGLVKTWAEKGYQDDARELMQVIGRYNPVPPTSDSWESHQWREAEEAVSTHPVTSSVLQR